MINLEETKKKLNDLQAKVDEAKRRKTIAETRLEEAKQREADIVEEMKKLGVTPDTIQAEIEKQETELLAHISEVEAKLQELENEVRL